MGQRPICNSTTTPNILAPEGPISPALKAIAFRAQHRRCWPTPNNTRTLGPFGPLHPCILRSWPIPPALHGNTLHRQLSLARPLGRAPHTTPHTHLHESGPRGLRPCVSNILQYCNILLTQSGWMAKPSILDGTDWWIGGFRPPYSPILGKARPPWRPLRAMGLRPIASCWGMALGPSPFRMRA